MWRALRNADCAEEVMSVQHTAGHTETSGNWAAEPPAVSRKSRTRLRLASVAARLPRRWRLPLATYAGCQMIFLFRWAAFLPGLLNYDSLTHVVHVTTGPWTNNESVLYDALVWLSLHVSSGLAALTWQTRAANLGLRCGTGFASGLR